MEFTSLFNLASYGVGALVVAGAGIAAVQSVFFTVKQQQDVLITRFGKHTRTEGTPGLKVKVPFIDKVAVRIGRDLMQSSETLETKTHDDLFVKLPITVQYEVKDSAKMYFQNRDATANMLKLVSAAVRTATSGKQFQELYTDRDQISLAVIDHISKDVEEFGIGIRRIVIDQPSVTAEIQESFNQVRASERRKESARNNADAHYIEVVRKAEADKDSRKLAGEGAANYRKALFNGYKEQFQDLAADPHIGTEGANAIVKLAMNLDAMCDVGKSGNMVVVPHSFNANTDLANIQALKDMRPANDKKPAVPAAPAA